MVTELVNRGVVIKTRMFERLIGRAAVRMRQFLCGLHGHDALLHFGQGRLSLVCVSCGHETPGWDLTSSPARGPVVRHRRVAQMPILGERRVA